MSDCLVITVSADGLAPSGARPSADTVMTLFWVPYIHMTGTLRVKFGQTDGFFCKRKQMPLNYVGWDFLSVMFIYDHISGILAKYHTYAGPWTNTLLSPTWKLTSLVTILFNIDGLNKTAAIWQTFWNLYSWI